jgi:GNAT superfamily N-acetyltransferase
LRTIAPDAYARLVLPHTAPLWAGKRDLQTYVSDTLAVARSRFGRRHYRTTGFFEGRTLLASFKAYDRSMHDGHHRLRALGIGAVFTPEHLRGRGYATAMLGAALDHARSDGYDLAYLFSDVGTPFYSAIGFRTLPSRQLSLRADTLPPRRLTVAPLRENDWNAVRRCYDLAARGHLRFERTPLVWEWIRLRMRQRSESTGGQPYNLTVRHGRGIGAYVIGERIPERDTYLVEEFGFADEVAALAIPALLRAAAGDLGRISGWLPPGGARELLPKANVRTRKIPILMAAPLSSAGMRVIKKLTQRGAADCCWPTDHL